MTITCWIIWLGSNQAVDFIVSTVCRATARWRWSTTAAGHCSIIKGSESVIQILARVHFRAMSHLHSQPLIAWQTGRRLRRCLWEERQTKKGQSPLEFTSVNWGVILFLTLVSVWICAYQYSLFRLPCSSGCLIYVMKIRTLQVSSWIQVPLLAWAQTQLQSEHLQVQGRKGLR